jgi:hypothetical protein
MSLCETMGYGHSIAGSALRWQLPPGVDPHPVPLGPDSLLQQPDHWNRGRGAVRVFDLSWQCDTYAVIVVIKNYKPRMF